MSLSLKLNRWGITSVCFGLVAALCVFLFTSATPALAQSATGTVTGQITDQQGAIIGGANIRLVDPATSSVHETVSNDVGRYTITNVNPATYDLTVTKAGFTASKLSAQKVEVGQVLTLNVSLQVGATTTTVEVQATAGADLQTLNATVGDTITNDSLNLMPNLGRDASTLSVLQVGVSLAGNVGGAATDQNAFSLDGVNNSDDMAGNNSTYTVANGYSGGGSTGGTPSGAMPTPIESIEEIKIGTSGQTADFNAAAGSQVQMATKRGTNQFHGALYEFYFANNVGAANTWQSNHTADAKLGLDYTPLPDTHRNRFGGAFGGPLTPKFWGGKTYFFTNYEGMRYPNVTTFEKGSPTALMRAGVLQMNNTAGVLTPYNLNPMPVTVGGTTYQPAQCTFSGAVGPCDPRQLGLSPAVSKIWGTMPMPNDPNFTVSSTTTGYVDGVNAQGYYSNGLALPQTSNFIVGRIDHDFGEKWKYMSSYRYYEFEQLVSTQVDIGGQLSGATAGTPTSFAPRPTKPSFWANGLTTTITPNITNDFRFGYLRNFWQWSTQAGPPQSSVPGLGGVLEIGGETNTGSLIPYNVDSQDVRQRFWDGHDYNLNDTISHLHGNHLFQYGGTYLRMFDYHGRNDNGVGIDTSPTYQSSATTTNSANYVLPNGAAANSGYPIMFNEITGLVSQSQVMYTRSGSNLTLNPVGTPGFDQSVIPTYELFGSDTWHIRPSLTLTYGLSWGVSMPPYEINGKQVEMLNTSTGQPIEIQQYMQARQTAALQGQVYEPQIGFATIRNIDGGADKYPYNPFYGGFSPRVSLAWNPKFGGDILGKVFGDGKSVIRGGYARIYGRVNGVDLMLVPLLGPGLLQAVSCPSPTMTGACTGGTPATAFRIGPDGLTAPLPGVGALASQITTNLPQPFIPGVTQNGILNTAAADGSELDPNEKPNHSDEVTLSVQRSLSAKQMLEVGYIGRKISNEFQEINLDAVPTMTTLGGQSFAQAYADVWSEMCGGAGPVCSSPNLKAVTAQPFFETAMGGAGSAYCAGFASCTAAVASNEASNFETAKAYQVWMDLSESTKPGWILPRSMLAQTGTGQQITGAFDFINSLGHGNYNAAFFTYTAKDWHGLTVRSNFTWARALGTGSVVQASSSITVPNPFDFNNFGTYGTQPFDVKFTYSLLMLYQEPWFKGQRGFVGRVLGGWTLAPLFTARSGLPQQVADSTGGEGFGEIYSGQTANYENAEPAAPFTGGNSYNYNVAKVSGAANPNNVATSGTTGLNLFNNPVQAFSEFRVPVLGLDQDTGGDGPLRGFGFWNLDATLSKDFRATERIGLTVMIQSINVLNHFAPNTPSLSLASPSNFGVVTSQYTTPNGAQARWMEFGLRLRF